MTDLDEAKALRFVLAAIAQAYPGPKGREYEAWVEGLAARLAAVERERDEARVAFAAETRASRALVAALREYGGHKNDCAHWHRDAFGLPFACTCGFTAALLPAASPEPQGTPDYAEAMLRALPERAEKDAQRLIFIAECLEEADAPGHHWPLSVEILREIAVRLRSPEPVAREGLNTRGALNLIAAERRRQLERHGWTVQHDDEHRHGEMAIEAARYATDSTDAFVSHPDDDTPHYNGHEHPGWTNHQHRMEKSEMRRLVIAGALIVAEIERMVRTGEPYHDVPLPPAPTQREGLDAQDWEALGIVVRPKCAICGKSATCFGSYEELPAAFACDECCGHGNEDGWCVPLAEIPEAFARLRSPEPVAREAPDWLLKLRTEIANEINRRYSMEEWSSTGMARINALQWALDRLPPAPTRWGSDPRDLPVPPAPAQREGAEAPVGPPDSPPPPRRLFA